ncbi:MAG TPA: hypothetical protein VFV50_11130 [Bdellovibrionales bacterium]|nr:hypothetical protein [Bdellovibrionales bacterium]
MKVTLAILFAFISSTALANDGFYQGAGSDMVPVTNEGLRVLEETLTFEPISPPACYELILPKGALKQPKFNGFLGVGKRAKDCDPRKFSSTFIAKWRVSAVYKIQALKSQADVQMGFPVLKWSTDFADEKGEELCCSGSFPGATGFKVTIDGKPVTLLSEGAIRAASHKAGSKTFDVGEVPLHGYFWKASFEQGKTYTLKTSYNQGVDYSTGFSTKAIENGGKPWYPLKSEVKPGSEQWAPGLFENLIYYLTPLSLWAPPAPERISIHLKLPAWMPVTLVHTNYPKATCLEPGQIHFELKQKLPDEELHVVFPEPPAAGKAPVLPKITNKAEWAAWRKTTGDAKITCALLEQLKVGADSQLRTVLNEFTCTPACTP